MATRLELIWTLTLLMVVVACSPASSPTGASSTKYLIESPKITNTREYFDIVPLNNCGGPTPVETTSAREHSVDVAASVGGQLGANFEVLKATIRSDLSASYGLKDSRSIKLTAPPNTNMQFKIKWTEENYIGNFLYESNQTGTYRVIKMGGVELVESKQLQCSSTELFPTATPPRFVPVQPTSTFTPFPTAVPRVAYGTIPFSLLNNMNQGARIIPPETLSVCYNQTMKLAGTPINFSYESGLRELPGGLLVFTDLEEPFCPLSDFPSFKIICAASTPKGYLRGFFEATGPFKTFPRMSGFYWSIAP